MNCENLKLSREQEVWVQLTNQVVPYIKSYYYISNWGRIGSMADGTFKILSPVKDRDGYLNVCLHLYLNIIDEIGHIRRQINKRVNRLVIMSFYPLPENYENLEVNHINNMRDDNHLWNLEWTTPKENTLHALKYGYKEIQDISGSNNPMAKLTEEDVYKITELLKSGKYSYKEIGNMFNISQPVISSIVNKRSWKHLNLEFSEDELYTIKINGIMHKDNSFRYPFTIEEMNQICKFFESADINNKLLYNNPVDILRDCFYTLELNKKYNFETKRKSLERILYKSIRYHNQITDKYNYNFIR